MPTDTDLNRELQQRIIEAADDYHYIGEEQWNQVIELRPATPHDELEFRRLVRAALLFYTRAYLVLLMVETDDEQQLEDLMELLHESEPAISEFLVKNDADSILLEESTSNLSQVFSVAEALRSALLDRSNQLAATLGSRFSAPSA